MMGITSKDILLRPIRKEDCERISLAFRDQGDTKAESQYLQYLEWQTSGIRDVILAEVKGEFAGYLTIQWTSGYPPFCAAGIPEIADFNVLKKFQRLGIGTMLMDEAEERIARVSPHVGIGVGLVKDYGAAQVLYVKRGYIPDGRGASYDSKPLAYNTRLIAGDDLILHLTKKFD